MASQAKRIEAKGDLSYDTGALAVAANNDDLTVTIPTRGHGPKGLVSVEVYYTTSIPKVLEIRQRSFPGGPARRVVGYDAVGVVDEFATPSQKVPLVLVANAAAATYAQGAPGFLTFEVEIGTAFEFEVYMQASGATAFGVRGAVL